MKILSHHAHTIFYGLKWVLKYYLYGENIKLSDWFQYNNNNNNNYDDDDDNDDDEDNNSNNNNKNNNNV